MSNVVAFVSAHAQNAQLRELADKVRKANPLLSEDALASKIVEEVRKDPSLEKKLVQYAAKNAIRDVFSGA